MLIHLVRNAIDHGVESPEQRVAAGQAAQGRDPGARRPRARLGLDPRRGRRARHGPRAHRRAPRSRAASSAPSGSPAMERAREAAALLPARGEHRRERHRHLRARRRHGRGQGPGRRLRRRAADRLAARAGHRRHAAPAADARDHPHPARRGPAARSTGCRSRTCCARPSSTRPTVEWSQRQPLLRLGRAAGAAARPRRAARPAAAGPARRTPGCSSRSRSSASAPRASRSTGCSAPTRW